MLKAGNTGRRYLYNACHPEPGLQKTMVEDREAAPLQELDSPPILYHAVEQALAQRGSLDSAEMLYAVGATNFGRGYIGGKMEKRPATSSQADLRSANQNSSGGLLAAGLEQCSCRYWAFGLYDEGVPSCRVPAKVLSRVL